MIIIRAKHDIQTSYTYSWSNEIIKTAEKNQFDVVKIEGQDITENSLRSRIENKKPKFIFFNGHGNTTSLFNNDEEPFIDKKSSDVFKNTVTFARACNCLEELGKSAVKKDCKAFIGYKKPFWVARNHKFECQPLKDNVAKPVFECSNVIAEELIKGKTVDEAVRKSHEKSADSILELIYSKEPLAAASLQAVVTNDLALGYEGIPSAKIRTS